MKIVLTVFSFIVLTFAVAHAEPPKYDILVTAGKLNFSPDLRQITLYSPNVNLKYEKANTHSQSLSINDFINLWKPSPGNKNSFAASNPNAILTCWNKEKNYLEASFIIEKTSVQGNKLVFDVKYLERDKAEEAADILPVTIDAEAATKDDLQKFLTSSTQVASVAVIVDNPDNPIDPHGGRH
ncbi:MAG: hypothetical protein BGO67_01305 [Alphaproteobacteria bacterium 41-28]|nr:MAG: hypothetical protein BGO67_01305 [Alphaproteobacteria bacterium 41-28]